MDACGTQDDVHSTEKKNKKLYQYSCWEEINADAGQSNEACQWHKHREQQIEKDNKTTSKYRMTPVVCSGRIKTHIPQAS